MKQQLDRIESILKSIHPETERKDDSEEEDNSEDMYYSAVEIYEEYTSEHYCVRHLRDIVSGIVAACRPYVEESDIRIIYLIC